MSARVWQLVEEYSGYLPGLYFEVGTNGHGNIATPYNKTATPLSRRLAREITSLREFHVNI